MRDTMRDAPGVGLAAPQVGAPLQIAVIEDREEYIQKIPAEDARERERTPTPYHVIINPVLTPEDQETAEFFEGCLSLAGFGALVARSRRVKVECLNEKAEPLVIHASGWYARLLQHEIAQLNGALYIDRMKPKSFSTLDNYMRQRAATTEPRP